MNHNKKIGAFGEKLAVDFLKNKGYEIIELNTRVGRYEIDIIARLKEVIVFIEVKTRLNDNTGLAEDSFIGKKTESFKNAGGIYIENNRIINNNFRFDLLAVDISSSKKLANIKHYIDII